jgi:uncharacterized RDD family membrane protein YckC
MDAASRDTREVLPGWVWVALVGAVLLLLPLWVLITAAVLQLSSAEPVSLRGWLSGSVWGALGLAALVGTAALLAGIAGLGGQVGLARSRAARRSLDAEVDADAVLAGVTLTAREISAYDPRLDEGGGLPMAAPGARVAAAAIDLGLVAVWFPIVPLFALFVARGGWRGTLLGDEMPAGIQVLLAACVGVFVVVAVVQHVFVAMTGQTIGKRMLGIRVVHATGRRATFVEAVVARWWLWGAIVLLVPGVGWIVGPLADLVLLFDRDHRTLHDLLAGTIVVDVR